MLSSLSHQVADYLSASRWVVGYSGGIDSLVLLYALHQLKQNDKATVYPSIVALHINHQLQPDAQFWQQTCLDQAKSLGIPFESISVDIEAGANIEEKARQARYQVFSDWLKAGDILMLAHHQMDQSETFLYRLLRGAGVTGLTAIPFTRPIGKACLIRPLLSTSKQVIEAFAKEHRLVPIEDPSNNDLSFDRNYIRHQIIPPIMQRWPNGLINIQTSIRHINETDQLLTEIAQEDLNRIGHGNDFEPWIDSRSLAELSFERRKNLLRVWLKQHHQVLQTKHWMVLFDEILGASIDAKPELRLAGAIIRRYQHRLYLSKVYESEEPFVWHTRDRLHLKGYPDLTLSLPVDTCLQVRFRQGGERLKLNDKQPVKKLKVLLQELHVPYWRRNHIPLIYYNDQLIAIGEKLHGQIAQSVLGDAKLIVCK